MSNQKRKRVLFVAGKTLLTIGILVLSAYVVPTYAAERTIVDGESMEANYYDGENVLVNKLSYHFSDPKRFDVITFYPYGQTLDHSIVAFYQGVITRKRGSDEYFVLGDNREISRDSRTIGPIKQKNIAGKVMMRFDVFDIFS